MAFRSQKVNEFFKVLRDMRNQRDKVTLTQLNGISRMCGFIRTEENCLTIERKL